MIFKLSNRQGRISISLCGKENIKNPNLLSKWLQRFIFSAAFHTVLYKFFNHQCAVFTSLASNVTQAVCRLWWINLSPTSHPQGFHLLISDHCLSAWTPHSFTLGGFRTALQLSLQKSPPHIPYSMTTTISGGRFAGERSLPLPLPIFTLFLCTTYVVWRHIRRHAPLN